MPEERHFFDVFKLYGESHPSADKRALLESATDVKVKMFSRSPLRTEVQLSFPAHADPELIYEIED